MKTTKSLIITILVTLLVLVVLRGGLWDVFTISADSYPSKLLPGDRLLVSRYSYGLRIPFTSNYDNWPRIGYRNAQRGDWMVFNSPADTSVVISRRPTLIQQCTAVPGDTVWFTWNYRLVSHSYPSSKLYPFVVPGKDVLVDVRPWNARLLYLTLHLYEKRNASLKGDSALYINGKRARRISFKQDYYWVSSGNEANRYDSRYFGFVPHSHLLGRIECVLFSKKPGTPLFEGFRERRTFYSLSRSPRTLYLVNEK